jgi:hypothetical protein
VSDKPLTWRQVPESERERLRAREAAQRSETRNRGMKVEPVSVEGLWMLQRGMCGCDERCAPLNPFAKPYADDQTIIGHIDGRHFTECHTIDSVRLQLASCNRKDAGREATERASRKKAAAVRGLKEVVEVDHDRPEQKSRWGSQKLKSRNEWPPKGSRKIANRGFGK